MSLDRVSAEFLFIREEPEEADLAIVFGSADPHDLAGRTDRAVELHLQGYVPRLLLTGGGSLAPTASEARRMAEIARRLEVPGHDLLIEDRSNSTIENARFCRELLQELGLLPTLSTILLVSSEWHMRRTLWTMQTEFPDQVRFVCCPSLVGCTSDNWISSDEYRTTVRHELSLLRSFHAAGMFDRIKAVPPSVPRT